MQTRLAVFTFLLSFGLLILGAAPKSEKYEKLLKTTQEKKTGMLEFSGDTIEKIFKIFKGLFYNFATYNGENF